MSIVNFLYNPDRKGRDQLISEFVVRTGAFEEIMHDLESSDMKMPEQHYLLVGQRGSGKSTLLNRIKYAVEDSPNLSLALIPILFGEEQYNVGELANLWENIAQLLEDYYGFEGIYDRMEKYVQEENFEDKCWDILESALDKDGKKILLLIDNIGDMFKKVGDRDVRRLRELLQTKPQIRLIAASPFYLESLLDYKQSFFEFFKVVRLDELSSTETCELLLKLGEIHDEKEKIECIIKESPGRIETLRTLTGGVPRTIALMFNIFIEHEHENTLKDLDKILDNVTPLYKHRMDDLPAQQQKIVDAVAKNWDPISVKDLKGKIRLESKVISAQLRQLEKNQVVQKLETGTKNNEYILKERFFNIWYLMRYGRKDDKQRVIWLVRFLESWCTDEEIEKRVANFIKQIKGKKVGKEDLVFFAETYASMSRLKIGSKLKLRDHLSEHSISVMMTDEEIDEALRKEIIKVDFKRMVSLMSDKIDLSDDDKNLIANTVIDKTNNKSVFLKTIENILNSRAKQGKPIFTVYKIWVNVFCLLSMAHIGEKIEANEIEKALEEAKNLFEVAASLSVPYGDYYSDVKFEMFIVLFVVHILYKAGQYYSLYKFFDEAILDVSALGSVVKGVKLSEIFNPLYLALVSLGPERKKVNIAPEKKKVVQEIRLMISKGRIG